MPSEAGKHLSPIEVMRVCTNDWADLSPGTSNLLKRRPNAAVAS